MRFEQHLKKSSKLFFKHKIMPEYVTLFVTNRCNARCEHCFYWKELDADIDRISLDEYTKIAKSMDDFLFLLLTGGEPFLRKDLHEIARIFYDNNHVRKMTIVTNGMLTAPIVESVSTLLANCPDLHLSVSVSLDAVGAPHDAIRRVEGLYDNAVATLAQLKILQKSRPKLSVGVAMTYAAFNQDTILATYDHIKTHVQPDYVNCSYVRGEPMSPATKDCRIENYVTLQERMKQDLIDRRVQGVRDPLIGDLVAAAKFQATDQLIQTVREDRYLSPCYAGQINAVIYPGGDVYPCEILSDKIGNLREAGYDFRKLWMSPTADAIREKIRVTNCYCTHECNTLPNVMFNPKFIPKIVANYMKLVGQ